MTDRTSRTRGELPQRGNPHQLSRRLHVFPAKSIQRFECATGGVDLFDVVRERRRRAKPDDPIFCADRSWDHAAETGYMKQIEDDFQALVTHVLNGKRAFDASERNIIAEFYGLWAARARWRNLTAQAIPLGPNVLGTRVDYSKDELERLEKHGVAGIRPDATLAMRHVSAIQIRLETDRCRESCRGCDWGVLTATDAEFCVPDVPSQGVIPVAPSTALALKNDNCVLTSQESGDINKTLSLSVREYLFAHDLSACPGISAGDE
jgi:hypothetical protein